MTIDLATSLEEIETAITELMPTALGMVADVVEQPNSEPADYVGWFTIAEQAGPLLTVALIRACAGVAAIAELSPDQVRALADRVPELGDMPDLNRD